MNERRAFIRHPVDVPIQIRPQEDVAIQEISMSDVGEGGVAFYTNVAFKNGAILSIKIAHVTPPFEALCVICWQKEVENIFEVGVRFLDAQSQFRARMVEQVCHIEDYRKKNEQEGRVLSSEEAAREWIAEYAADFGRVELK